MTTPAPFVLEDRQPVYRVFALVFALATAVVGYSLVTARFAGWGDRGVTLGLGVVGLVLTLSFLRAPWRRVTRVEGDAVTVTAHRFVGQSVTQFALADIEAVEIPKKMPLRVVVKLRDGRQVEAIEPMGRKGGTVEQQIADAKPRAAALARGLKTTVRDAS